LAQILLFIGALLVAFQYVGDIGYAATLFSAPFVLPLKPIMNKLGIAIKKTSSTQLSIEMKKSRARTKMFKVTQVFWWILLILTVCFFAIITVVTQPIMIAYLMVGRPLLGINKLLNFLYEKFFSQWQDIYLVGINNYLAVTKKYFRIQTTKEKYTDEEWLEIRKKKGELPFLAFIGLLCIIAGFVLQLI